MTLFAVNPANGKTLAEYDETSPEGVERAIERQRSRAEKCAWVCDYRTGAHSHFPWADS